MDQPERGGQVAWLPAREASWEEDDAAVRGWLADRHAESRLGPTVVSNTASEDLAELLDGVSGQITRVNQRRRHPAVRTGGPVLVCYPTTATFVTAWRHDRSVAFCVIEDSAQLPLLGWAQQVAAVDLTTGRVTPDTRSSDLIEDLEHMEFYGNNGWGVAYDRDAAMRILDTIAGRGELDRDLVIGYMLAGYKISSNGITNLGRLIDKVAGMARA